MIKQFFPVLVLCCGALCADAAVQYMIVEQKSGEKFSFLLKDNPVITYEDGALVVNGSATTSYALEGLRNYHFSEDGEAGVERLSANVVRVYSLDDNTIGVENAPNGSKISLVNINGFVVFSSKAAPSGVATVSLPKEKGVYVLSVGDQSFKIIRK